MHLWFIIDGIDEILALDTLGTECSSKAFTKVVRSLKPLIDVAAKSEHINIKLFLPDCDN